MIFRATLSALAGLFCGQLLAATLYVTDELSITVRSGQDNTYRVINGLKSGDPVEVLQDFPDSGYSQVRLQDGTEGFVLTRFLTTRLPAKRQLEDALAELESLKGAPDEIQQRAAELQEKYTTLSGEHERLSAENEDLKQKMTVIRQNATDVVALMQERDETVERANALSTEVDELRLKNLELTNHSDKKWFMVGAGILAAGLVLGLIIPRLGMRRRRPGWGGNDLSF